MKKHYININKMRILKYLIFRMYYIKKECTISE